MEYRKIINLLENTPIVMMLKSTLCDYSDAYIIFKETITLPDTSAAVQEQTMVIRR